MKILLIIAAVLFIILLIWFFCERRILRITREKILVKDLPADFDGTRILQISDIHHRKFGKDNVKISDIAAALRPDFIFLTGDMVSRNEKDFSSVENLCRKLSAAAPVYFVFGNHELDFTGKRRDDYISALQGAGVTILDNSRVTIQRKSSSIDIAGATLSKAIYRDENKSYRNLSSYSIYELENSIGVRIRCTLLLAHNPLISDVYAEWNADVVFSGHVHGGLIRLPFIGGLLSPERRFFPRYTKGMYPLKETILYVSGGVGKIRLFNPAEINFITLRSE